MSTRSDETEVKELLDWASLPESESSPDLLSPFLDGVGSSRLFAPPCPLTSAPFRVVSSFSFLLWAADL